MFLPMISQVKKKIISQVLVLLCRGIHFFSPIPRSGVGLCREKNSNWSLGSASKAV
jgi:hypothetical protein